MREAAGHGASAERAPVPCSRRGDGRQAGARSRSPDRRSTRQPDAATSAGNGAKATKAKPPTCAGHVGTGGSMPEQAPEVLREPHRHAKVERGRRDAAVARRHAAREGIPVAGVAPEADVGMEAPPAEVVPADRVGRRVALGDQDERAARHAHGRGARCAPSRPSSRAASSSAHRTGWGRARSARRGSARAGDDGAAHAGDDHLAHAGRAHERCQQRRAGGRRARPPR